MKQALDFEKPLIKAREELEELRKLKDLKNTQKISMAFTEMESAFQEAILRPNPFAPKS